MVNCLYSKSTSPQQNSGGKKSLLTHIDDWSQYITL